MSTHHGRPMSEAGSISASLSALVDLFEFFSDTLRDLRGQRIAAIRQPWKEYFGSDSPSLDEVLNETALAVLECQLKLLTLLTETRLEELTPHVDGPFTVSDEASRYRKRAEEKLLEVYDRVSIAKSLLGKAADEDEESAPKLHSQSGMKLNLLLEREDTPVDENVINESDNAFQVAEDNADFSELVDAVEQTDNRDKETKLTASEPFEVENNAVGDMNVSTSDGKEAILETKELAELEEKGIVSEEIFREHTATPEDQVPAANVGSEPEKLAELSAGYKGTEENAGPAEREATVPNRASLKLVSSDPMVGAGRYDVFDGSEDDDRSRQKLEAEPQASELPDDEEEPTKEQVLDVPPDASAEHAEAQPPAVGGGVDLHKEPSSKQGKLDALIQNIARLKKVHRDASDLKVKTSGGTWTLSLPYYHGIGGSGEPTSILDLENFIGIHNLAFRGVLDAATKQGMDDSDPRILKLVQKLHTYFRRLYGNITIVISAHGRRNLPDTGGSFDPDILMLLEADLVIFDWKSAEDVREFRQIFQKELAKPFNEFLADSENKLAYLESIAELG